MKNPTNSSTKHLHIKKDWWKKTFSPIYFSSYQEDFSEKNNIEQVNFLINKLGLNKNMEILDLGCGIGRHAIALAKRGYKVTGLDYSSTLLKIAKTEARKNNVSVKFIKGDFRNLFLKKKYDIILCLFTTLGYFDYNENQKAFVEMAKTLKPDGKILIDLYDYAQVLNKFNLKGVKTSRNNIVKIVTKYKRGNIPTYDTQTFDFSTNIEYTKRVFTINKKKYQYDLYLTFYNIETYKHFLNNAGLKLINLWGEFDGSPRTDSTTRTIMLIQKKFSKQDNFLDTVNKLLNIIKTKISLY